MRPRRAAYINRRISAATGAFVLRRIGKQRGKPLGQGHDGGALVLGIERDLARRQDHDRIPGCTPARAADLRTAQCRLRNTSTSSCAITCKGRPARLARRTWSSAKNDARGNSPSPRSPARRATFRS
jgi:hypothetical protein